MQLFAAVDYNPQSWTESARRLFGESDEVLEKSKSHLLSIKDLDEILQTNIKNGPNKDLALDVVAGLQKKGFVDFLLEQSAEDQTGRVYLTLNTLLTKSNEKKIFSIYAERLLSNKMSDAARVVLIDTLGRGRVNFSKEHISDWLLKGSFELQQSLLVYIKRMKANFNNAEMKGVLKLALLSSYFQIRLQTLYEFPYYLIDFSLCKNDSSSEVKILCKSKEKEKGIDW